MQEAETGVGVGVGVGGKEALFSLILLGPVVGVTFPKQFLGLALMIPGLMWLMVELELQGWVSSPHDRNPPLTSFSGRSWDKKSCRVAWSSSRSGTGPSIDSWQPL